MSKKYKTDTVFYYWSRSVMCLPFVPLDLLDSAITYLFDTNIPFGCSKLKTYFLNTWKNGEFTPKMWNQSEVKHPKTNIQVENFHGSLKKILGSSRPCIHKIIEIIKRIETRSILTYSYLELAKIKSERKQCEIEKDRKLKDTINKLNNKTINFSTFFKIVVDQVTKQKPKTILVKDDKNNKNK